MVPSKNVLKPTHDLYVVCSTEPFLLHVATSHSNLGTLISNPFHFSLLLGHLLASFEVSSKMVFAGKGLAQRQVTSPVVTHVEPGTAKLHFMDSHLVS